MAGRGRGKTLPAWMTNGGLAAMTFDAAPAGPAGDQYSDAQNQFQQPPLQQPRTRESKFSSAPPSYGGPQPSGQNQFQPPSYNNGHEQFSNQPSYGGQEPQMQSLDRGNNLGNLILRGPPPRGLPPQLQLPSARLETPAPMHTMSRESPVEYEQQPSQIQSQPHSIAPQMGIAPGMFAQHQPIPLAMPQFNFQQQQQQQQVPSQQPFQQQPTAQQPTIQQQNPITQGYQQQPRLQLQQPPAMGLSSASTPGMPVFSQPPDRGNGHVGGPMGFTPRGIPQFTGAPAASNPPPAVVGDPNNDVSSWSEHDAEDKRKYWYNRVTGTSTYEKPFCLKTPEERSIPPCKWKEYTAPADGKKYYSDGKDSR